MTRRWRATLSIFGAAAVLTGGSGASRACSWGTPKSFEASAPVVSRGPVVEGIEMPGPAASSSPVTEALVPLASSGPDVEGVDPDPPAAEAAPLDAPRFPEPSQRSDDTEEREDESRPYLLDRLAAGASVGYFTSERARILSEAHFDFPFLVVQQKSLYVRGRLETSTVKTRSRFHADSFRAQGIDYLVEVGARDYLNNRIAIAGFVGLQGRSKLDKAGSRFVEYIGLGFESVGYPRPGGRDRFEWRLAAGPTFVSETVESDAVVRGSFLYDVWRGTRSSIGIDGSFDSLFNGLSGMTEYRVGPRWTLPLANGIRAAVFAEWIRGRNPLLLQGHEGWNFGFRYAEGAYSGPHTMPLPDVRGVLSFGRGSRRGFGRFDLDLSSPELRFLGTTGRIYANLDANLVGGTGTDNLYYIATAGIEAHLRRRMMVGPVISHRSNHTLGQGPTEATNLNLVQVSLRTEGWEYANRLPGQLIPGPEKTWRDRFEWSLAPGLVTDSAFSEARSWDLQAGARLDLAPRHSRMVPFVRVFSEWGEAERREGAIGFSTRQNLVIELRYRRDSQYFGEETRNAFVSGSLFF